LFPNQDTVNSTTQLNTTSSGGKSLKFDFETGDFVTKDGKVQTVTGIDAVKLWIQKILKTEKNKYKIYNTDNAEKYGIKLLELITGKYPIAYKQAQVETVITEALLKNSDIRSVNNFTFVRDKRLLNVSFTVNTVYGTTESEVII
jgi:hypothetical protein